MKNISLIDFIKSNSNWRELLTEPPYCLKMQEKGNLILFKYSQIDSDFSYELVRQARGIILEQNTWKIVCYPFKKFFNQGDPKAAVIDWSSSIITEKVDGSTIKFFSYDNMWNIATSGCIDAHDARVVNPFNDNECSFYDLVMDALKNKGTFFDELVSRFDADFTYIFELTHPVSKIVVSYQPNLYLIGMRNNKTCEEVNVFDGSMKFAFEGIDSPKVYHFNNMNEILEISHTLSNDQEGFVVMDKYFNRVKIKGDAYLALHRVAGGRNLTTKNLLDCILTETDDDVLGSFPEYTEKITKVKNKLLDFVSSIERDANEIFSKFKKDDSVEEKVNRKNFAMLASKTTYPTIIFQMYDGSVTHDMIRKTVYAMGADRLSKIIVE